MACGRPRGIHTRLAQVLSPKRTLWLDPRTPGGRAGAEGLVPGSSDHRWAFQRCLDLRALTSLVN